jgi:hypothetical protein
MPLTVTEVKTSAMCIVQVQAVRVAPDFYYSDMMLYGVIYSSMSTNYKKLTLCYVISSSSCIHKSGLDWPLW